MSKQHTARRAMLAKIHLARKALNMDETAYRAMLMRIAGVDSAGQMNEIQLDKILKEMQRLGFRPQNKRGKTPRSGKDNRPSMAKIGAILADLQLPWAYAHGMGKKMVGKENLTFCTPEELRKVLQALIIHQKRKV